MIPPNEILIQNFLTVNVTEEKETLSNLIFYPTSSSTSSRTATRTTSSSTTSVISSTNIDSESTKSLDLNKSISEDLSWRATSSKIDQLDQTNDAEGIIAQRFGDFETTASTSTKSDSIIFNDAVNISLKLSLKSSDPQQNDSVENFQNNILSSKSTTTSSTTTISTTTTSLTTTSITTTTTTTTSITTTSKSSASEEGFRNLQREILTGLFSFL